MMIELNQISRTDFKIQVLKNKDSIHWFIWYVQNKVDGIEFKSLFSNNNEIGVCFFIETTDSTEIGILISKDYRQNGFGTDLIKQLILHRKKALKFIVSKYNTASLSFFKKLTNEGILDSCQNERGTVFTSANKEVNSN